MRWERYGGVSAVGGYRDYEGVGLMQGADKEEFAYKFCKYRKSSDKA